ncbi:hypothetical protein [Lacihabitans lacunae]|uniref:Beta-propeller repeat protein n=1 Tax=Lacihabitans lacunae TaxID=1028214 RepID=A0ABV7YVS2_9BACT
MKIKQLYIFLCLSFAIKTQAQFANVTQNNVHVPQLTNSQLAAIPSPQKGMLAYNLSTNCLSYYDGSQWKCSDITKSTSVAKATISQPITGGFLHYAHGLAADNDFTYIAGSFSGTNISLCDTTLTATGSLNMYFAKLNSKGCLVWAKAFGTSSWNEAYDIKTDASGNVYVTGHFSGTVNFGNGNLTAAGGSDIFVAKYSSAGVLQWVQKAGSSDSNFEYGYGLSLDGSQNVYIVGSFRGTANFGANSRTSAGDEDIFVAKYDNAGNIQWVNTYGGSYKDIAKDIAINTANDVFVVGNFSSAFSYAGNAISPPYVGTSDAFIAKHSISGTVSWVKRGGGNYADTGNAVAVDGSGNAFLAGGFADVATFGTTNIVATNSYLDAYIAKFNSAGASQWVTKAGGQVDDEAKGIFIDASGNIYQTGYYTGTVFFGTKPLNPFGTKDYFIAKYDETGAFLWVKNGGSTADDFGSRVVKGGSKIRVFGTFSGKGFFDKLILFSGSGNANVFLQNLDE